VTMGWVVQVGYARVPRSPEPTAVRITFSDQAKRTSS
jgi:hypothetical protein